MFYLNCETLSARGKKIGVRRVGEWASKRCKRVMRTRVYTRKWIGHCLFYYELLSHKIWVMLNMSVFISVLLQAYSNPCVHFSVFLCVCVFPLSVLQPGVTDSISAWAHLQSITTQIYLITGNFLTYSTSTSNGFQVVWAHSRVVWSDHLPCFSIQGFEPECLYTGENFGKVLTTLLAVNFATQGKGLQFHKFCFLVNLDKSIICNLIVKEMSNVMKLE